jgi:muconate cycloisomerase
LIERVQVHRSSPVPLGDRPRVYVDINQSWNETTAVWAIERLQHAVSSLSNRRCLTADIEGMWRLSERFAVPIMADEVVNTIDGAMAFARNLAAGAFSLKLVKRAECSSKVNRT